MEPKERLAFARESLGFSIEQFSAILDYEIRSYKNIESGSDKISDKFLRKLKIKTGVNPEWIFSGEGHMILDRENEIIGQNINIYPENLKSAQGEKISEKRIPYYEIPATMSPLAVYSDDKEIPVYYIEMPALKDCDFALPAWGDSMYPKIKNGQIIAVKEIKDKSQILWGEIYLVITDEIRAVKYLRKHKDESKVILASENKEHFDDIVIDKNKILNLFIVKGQINILIN